MSAEQIIVFALLVAAFVAGWVARDPPRREAEADGDDAPRDQAERDGTARDDLAHSIGLPSPEQHALPPPPAPSPAGPPPALLDAALDAYDGALDAWMAGRDGRAAVGDFERAVDALRSAAGAKPPAALADAIAALEQTVRLLAPAREGRPLDAATSKALEPLEDRFERAWRALN